jgi:hypothetical protein
MVHEHLKGLRLDRRALRRRDWISPEELKKELAALPDVSGKIDDSTPDAAAVPAEGSKG